MPRVLEFTVPASYEGKKVREFLRNGVQVSARLLRALKNQPDGICRNGSAVRTVDLLHEGDRLQLTLPDEKEHGTRATLPMPLDVLYEDDDLLIVNKPAGLAMHETHNHQGDALSNAVAYYLQQHGRSAVFRTVGRLDKGTSGVVLCALNKYSAAKLAGHIQKEYLAVAGGVYEGYGTIDVPIYRPDANKTLRAAGADGDRAVTHWEALRSDGQVTLLRVQPETGRTHQIRVHFAHLGTPLVGDDMYGSRDTRLTHQALHCARIRFTHPVTGEMLDISAPTPTDMAALVPNVRTDIYIREAKTSDCGALARLKRRVWEETYRGIYPDEKLDNFDEDAQAQAFADLLVREDVRLFVAEAGDEIIAYMACGAPRRPFGDFKQEIGLLYVRKDHQGQGLGRRLFSLGKAKIAESGAQKFFISCNLYNLPARGFYEKMGGVLAGVFLDGNDKSNAQVKYVYRI